MNYIDPKAPRSEIGAMAAAAGVTYGFVWRILRGNARPSLPTARLLARHAGVSLDDLEGWIAQKRIELWPDSPEKNTGAGHES